MTPALTSALLHFIWQGALIALLLAVALALASAARTRYAIACGALLLMVVSFAATFLWMLPHESAAVAGNPVATFATRIPIFDGPFDSQTAPGFRAWIVPVWFFGVALFYAYRMAGWFAARRLRRAGACHAPELWQARLRELAKRIRLTRPVTLLESTLARTPATVGAMRPVILVPLGLLAGLPSAQIEALLLHELAHIRRHDYLVNLLQSAIEGLLFYHPAVWWVSRQIRVEREFCCDDLVVAATEDTGTYVRALNALEYRRALASEAALAATDGPLARRVRRLLAGSAPRRGLAGPVLGLLMLVTCVALVAWQPQPSPVPTPAPTPTPAPAPTPEPQPPRPAQTKPAPPEPARANVATMPYQRWLDEEVVYIIQPAERDAFLRLSTDDERAMFIEQFWLRRDPTPDTPANELREEHYRRIAWSNDRFFTFEKAGWRTDRGQIYIKFGPADEVDSYPNPGRGVPNPYERWRYRFIEGIGRDVIMEFVDKTMDNDYRMTLDPSQR